MVDSIFLNSGRGCINCSGIWARHTREIADATARLAAVRPLPPEHPDSSLAAFTVPGQAEAIPKSIDAGLQASGVVDVTAGLPRRRGFEKQGRAEYILPTIVHRESPEPAIAKQEHALLRPSWSAPRPRCWNPSGRRWCAARSRASRSSGARCWTPSIDCLNFGPVPTTKLNWLQPHEGNIVDFLFRARVPIR